MYPKECEGQWGEWAARHKHFPLDTWVGEGSRPGLPDLQGNLVVRQGLHLAVRRVLAPPPPLGRSRGVVNLGWAGAGLQDRQLLEGTGERFGSLQLLQQPEMMQHWGWWGTLETEQKAAWTHPSAELG